MIYTLAAVARPPDRSAMRVAEKPHVEASPPAFLWHHLLHPDPLRVFGGSGPYPNAGHQEDRLGNSKGGLAHRMRSLR